MRSSTLLSYFLGIISIFAISSIVMSQKMLMSLSMPNVETSSLNVPPFSDEWVVLLTTCRNRPDHNSALIHEAIYKKQIIRWLEESGLPIFVIESSGVGFPELERDYPNLHVITTNITNVTSSSFGEAESLLAAMKGMKNYEKFNETKYVMKVTGRYFLEGVKDVIDKKLKTGADFYVQLHFNDKINWQNSEYFGMKKELIPDLANLVLRDRIFMEHVLYNVTRNTTKHFDIFEEGFANDQARGGDKMVINPLR